MESSRIGLGIGLALAAMAACTGDVGSLLGVPGAGGASGTGSANGTNGSGSGAGGGVDISSGSGSCTGLECQQVPCSGAAKTTVSGTVYAPEGTLPLYNVLVYVPNAPLDDIPDGASCDKCGFVSGAPLVTALTDTHGRFVLENVPVGSDIPLVIQVGKWRRQLKLPSVAKCSDTPIADHELTSLPSKQSEGHIPRIALTTGGADPLEYLLRKIGLEPQEFTTSSGNGRVNLFAASGGSKAYLGINNDAAIEPAVPFWSALATLKKYDLVLLACEGDQVISEKSVAARQAMQDYAAAGGRIFMSHWHNVWLQQGPAPWPTTAKWDFQNDPPEPYTGVVQTGFPKGKALSDWLVNVGASSTPGELPITAPQHTVSTVNNAAVTPWITGKKPDTGSVKYLTFNAPMGAPDDKVCGRVVFSDIHVSSGDKTGKPFPTGCVTSGLSPQEKALVFMLFDLSACVQNDNEPPIPPAK